MRNTTGCVLRMNNILLTFIKNCAMLMYTVIKNKTQYKNYCQRLEALLERGPLKGAQKDEAELLTLLIEKWDEAHNTFDEVDPVQLLRGLMSEKGMKPKDLVNLLEVSKGLVSDILNYKKGLSKEIIRVLAQHFKVSQEAFNRPYKLRVAQNPRLKNAGVMNTRKVLQPV